MVSSERGHNNKKYEGIPFLLLHESLLRERITVIDIVCLFKESQLAMGLNHKYRFVTIATGCNSVKRMLYSSTHKLANEM